MRFELLSPDGLEIGYVSDLPEFNFEVDRNAPFREQIIRYIRESKNYQMVITGDVEKKDLAVTPPEEEVTASDRLRVIRLVSELPSNVPVQVRPAEDMGKWDIAGHAVQTLQKDRRYIDHPSEAPDGADVQEGPQGGLYYEVEGTDGSTEETAEGPSESDVKTLLESANVDFKNLEVAQTHHGDTFRMLHMEEKQKIRKALSDKFGEDVVSRSFEDMRSWKAGSYDENAQRQEKAFVEALGIDGDVRNGELDSRDPTEEEVEVAKAISEISQEIARRLYGDEVEVHRGFRFEAGAQLVSEYFKDPTADEYTFDDVPMTNYSTDKESAAPFGENGAMISRTVPVDDVIRTTDQLWSGSGRGSYHSEIAIKGGRTTVGSGEVKLFGKYALTDNQFGQDFASLPDPAVKMFENMIRYIEEEGRGYTPDEEAIEGMRRAVNEYEERFGENEELRNRIDRLSGR